ncbi:hypothetical protein K469DRAFT_580387, partial [Zopfia rhizophila CBS 207.26]
KVNLAFLFTGNEIGLRLFQFINPPVSESSSFNYTRGGVFHLAVCERVVRAGGKKTGETVTPAICERGAERQVALYCRDPWRIVIEACCCSFEKMIANRE